MRFLTNILDYCKNNTKIIFVLLFFGVIFCLLALVNHANFRTYAWDLGIYNQTIYDYAHFRLNHNTVLQPPTSNIISDHFTLLHFFISPLYWIFKSYTLLVVQLLSILLGGLGVYEYIKLKSKKNINLSVLAAIFFFSLWGIYSALGFGYHDNVVGAMFVPWFIYFLAKDKLKSATICFIILLISKENMIMWAIFLAFGMLLANYKEVKKRNFLIGLTVFGVIFFMLVMKVFMPALADEGKTYVHFTYSVLGTTFSEAIWSIIVNPWHAAEAFFTNFSNNTEAEGVKMEFFLVFLFSGGVLLFKKPHYLVVLLPIFGQKLFSDDFLKWGLSSQYSVEFAPILAIGVFELLAETKNKNKLKWGVLLTIVAAYITFTKIEHRLPVWFDGSGMKFYSKQHYKTPYDKKKIKAAMKLIPADAKLSGEANIVPHLSARKTIYQYPKIADADYIILLPSDAYWYPLVEQEYNDRLAGLRTNPEWQIMFDDKDVVLFKKQTGIINE